MKKIRSRSILLSVVLVGWITVGAINKKATTPTVTEDTYLGPISCTVTMFKVVQPKPGMTLTPGTPPTAGMPRTAGEQQTPGSQPNPGDMTTIQATGAVALPQPPGLVLPQPPNNAQTASSANSAPGQMPTPGAQQPGIANGVAQPATAPNGTTPAPPLTNEPPKKILNYRDCLANGGLVVILPDGQSKTLILENPEIIQGHEWQRLSLSGYLKGTLFHVVSVRMI